MKDTFNVPLEEDEIEVKLWEYIDGLAKADEMSAIEKLVQENAEWKAKYQELLEVHESLNLVELEQPSLRFTKNVMEEIARLQIAPAAKQYINSKIIWGIGGFFITVIVSFLVYGLAQIDWSTSQSVNTGVLDKITDADYTKVFNNTFVNVFIMLNVVLGLMLFDRYLNDKKKKLMKEA
jgi:regulatory protein YycI of two-component signal transduction system YycFG